MRPRGAERVGRTAIAVALVAVGIGAARADSGGLFAEQFTAVDGVTVRRVRDTATGVVCYVATGGGLISKNEYYASGMVRPVAISCLRVDGGGK